MKNYLKLFAPAVMAGSALILSACGGGSSDSGGSAATVTLLQAAFNGSTGDYEYGHDSFDVQVTGMPDDTDFERYAMLYDGGDYRLYFFKKNSDDTLYQAAFNASSNAYEYDFGGSIEELLITDAPSDTDTGSFAMLHDGDEYRLYMQKEDEPTTLYQFAFNPDTLAYEYGYHSNDILYITDAPDDADFSRWAMLYAEDKYRLYSGRNGTDNELYQFAYVDASGDYEPFSELPRIDLTGMPSTAINGNFSMLYDGTDYRFYQVSLGE